MNFRESLANLVTAGAVSQLREANAELLQEAEAGNLGTRFFREALHELESGLFSRGENGWSVLDGAQGQKEFSRAALKRIHRIGLLMYLKNPLIKRGVNVQSHYVFGQGCSTQIGGESPAATEANQVLQRFFDDTRNRNVITAQQAQSRKERELQIFGNIFFVFFVNKATGHVRIRTLDVDEIDDVVSNPDDREEPWFYKRTYSRRTLDYQTGKTKSQIVTEYYPDWNHNPARKRASLGGCKIHWDRPVYHVKGEYVGAVGIAPSEIYAAFDWATAYTKFLENRATVARALSRFAMKATAATKRGVEAVKARLASVVSRPSVGSSAGMDGHPPDAAGSTAVQGPGRNIEAFSVKGATINPDEGRRFLLMVCASFGLAETFFGDVSVGTLATATSLDRPTELMMEDRRTLWKTALVNIAAFVLIQAIRAPLNPLSRLGRIEYHDSTPSVLLPDEKGALAPALIDVDFPPLLEHETDKRVAAIMQAAPFLRLPKLIARLLLSALGEDDIDERLKEMPDAEPLPLPGSTAPGQSTPALPAADHSARNNPPAPSPAVPPAPDES